MCLLGPLIKIVTDWGFSTFSMNVNLSSPYIKTLVITDSCSNTFFDLQECAHRLVQPFPSTLEQDHPQNSLQYPHRPGLAWHNINNIRARHALKQFLSTNYLSIFLRLALLRAKIPAFASMSNEIGSIPCNRRDQ